MRRYLPILLLIGLACGKDLHLVSYDGRAVTIKQAKYGFSGEIFYLNGTQCLLKNVNYKTKMVEVKYRQKFKFFLQHKNIPFDSIASFRFKERSFRTIPMLIGGGIGYYFLYNPKADTLSFVFGTIPAFSLGLALSLVPKYSKELIVGDGAWSIKVK